MTIKVKNQLQSSLSFLLGFIFVTAGIEKFTGLPDIIGPHYLIGELAKHNLKLFGQLIAFSQLFIGFLLLTNRFRTLGAIMLFPLLMNILVITISLKWSGTPFIVAFLLLLNIILLLLDFNKFKFLFSNVEYKELEEIKIKRSESYKDYYFLILLLIIYTGAFFGWSEKGEWFAKAGFHITLISLFVFNILKFNKRRKSKVLD